MGNDFFASALVSECGHSECAGIGRCQERGHLLRVHFAAGDKDAM
jgi:hypothetical protein